MDARIDSGWLEIDGDRLYRWQGEIDREDAAKLLERGARLAVMRWFEAIGFEWLAVPNARTAGTTRRQLADWLKSVLDSEKRKSSHGVNYFLGHCISKELGNVVLIAPGDY